ncbi:unnamed protein product [Closterium sp. NIES-64]|nr:unnamed protein product [Closterium sp. NIES-64]
MGGTTSMPMLAAVPAMMRMAASTVVQLRSGSFSVAISLTCSTVTFPTFSFPGGEGSGVERETGKERGGMEGGKRKEGRREREREGERERERERERVRVREREREKKKRGERVEGGNREKSCCEGFGGIERLWA